MPQKRLEAAELAAQTDLFDPVQLGPYELANRIVMAPLTRSRADDAGVPGELQATYYAQRASAGLIVTEATNISAQGKGYIRTPGIWSPAQVEGWKLTTSAVHAKGGRIFLQLWHVGPRLASRPAAGRRPAVAPSAVRAEGQQAYTYEGFKPLVTPRALETAEIPGIVADYAHAAKCAKEAGFDGVEIHSANGYLLQQFLSDKTNKRTDQYGGSIENRTRLVVEVVAAVTKVWGGDRVGIRLSPLTKFADIGDSNPEPVYLSLIEQINPFNLAYIHVIEGDTGGERHRPAASICRSCAAPSTVSTWPTTTTTWSSPSRRARRTSPTSSASGGRSSPTRISSSACARRPLASSRSQHLLCRRGAGIYDYRRFEPTLRWASWMSGPAR